jgi:hypothetical protein
MNYFSAAPDGLTTRMAVTVETTAIPAAKIQKAVPVNLPDSTPCHDP